jgi:DNA-binding NarL/FixJ family response regulator
MDRDWGGNMYERHPRVLLADDHPLLLVGLRKLLEPDFEVVGTAADGRALLRAAKILQPDLVIADTRRLRALVPAARVIILSIHAEPSWVGAAFAAGAYAYLTKISAPEEIETAIREVLKGRYYVSSVVTRAAIGLAQKGPAESTAAQPEAGESLTPRELDIFRLVGKGLGNKAIAHQLGVSVTTVRTHLSKVYDKLEPGSRVELALYAAKPGAAVM